jgi:hypothetical protein
MRFLKGVAEIVVWIESLALLHLVASDEVFCAGGQGSCFVQFPLHRCEHQDRDRDLRSAKSVNQLKAIPSPGMGTDSPRLNHLLEGLPPLRSSLFNIFPVPVFGKLSRNSM